MINLEIATQTKFISICHQADSEINKLNDKGQKIIPTSKVFTIYGLINNTAFCRDKNTGFLTDTPDGKGNKRTFHPEKVGEAFNCNLAIMAPVTYIRKYLMKWWPNLANFSCDAIRWARNLLCEMGCFKLEDRSAWKDNPKLRERRPNPMTEPDMVLMLAVALACEKRFIAEGYELNVMKLVDSENTTGDVTPVMVRDDERSLPAHGAETIRQTWNHAFGAICPWRRTGEVDSTGRYFYDEETTAGFEGELDPEVAIAIERTYNELGLAKETKIPVPPKPPVADPEVTREVWEAAKVTEVKEEVEPAIAVKVKVKPKLSAKAIIIPKFAWEMSAAATEWWQEIRKTSKWLFDHAPDWLMDEIIPF